MIDCGWIGLQTFFVVSGYLLTRILNRQKMKHLPNYFRNFFWHRVLRVFPLYYAYLAVVAAFFWIAKTPEAFKDEWQSLVTFTYNFLILKKDFHPQIAYVHFWTLSVDAQFYLLIPFAVYFLSPKQMKAVLISVILLAPAFRFFLAEALKADGRTAIRVGASISTFTFCQLDAFAAGAAIEIFDLGKRLKRPALLFVGMTFLFILTGAWCEWSLGQEIFNWDFLTSWGYPLYSLERYQHVWSYTLANFCNMLLVVSVVTFEKNRIQKVLSHPWLAEIGKVSYGMYLFSFTLLYAWRDFFGIKLEQGVWHFSVIPFFILIFILAQVSYRFFESRFLALKNPAEGSA